MQILNKLKSLIFACVLVFGYSGISSAAIYETRSGSGEIRFEADSTLHPIHGKAAQWSGSADFDPVRGIARTPFEIKVPVSSLDTDHAARDRAMQKMFDADRYPEAVLQIQQMECRADKEGAFNCTASGSFAIHGHTAVKKMEIRMIPFGQDGFQSSVNLPLSVEEFGLKPPSVLGMIKVKKTVELKVKINWRKK